MLRTNVARIEERLAALDRLTDEKFVTLAELMKFQADKVALALTAADKAVTKAEVANEKRFESVNEFRDTLSDQAATLVSRAEHDATSAAFADKLEDLKTRLDKAEGRGVGLNAGWIYVIGAVAAFGTIISIFIAFQN